MHISATDIPGVLLLSSERIGDARGSFARLFCSDELAAPLGNRHIAQINHSFSAERGTLRGMHYQLPPAAEMKIVRCLAGSIWDVVLDLRTSSPTFLQWRAFELDARKDQALLIPEGCAHGFQTLSDDVQLLYLHSAPYARELERGIRFNDPRIAIQWPLTPGNISQRDLLHPLLTSDFPGIEL